MADLKSMLLGSRNFKIKRLKVKVYEPDVKAFEEREIGVKQPTLFERARVGVDATRATTAEEKAKNSAQLVIYAACDPDTGERLFTQHDLAGLTAQAGGGWVDEVAMAALEMMSVPVLDSFCPEPVLGPDAKPVIEDGKQVRCGGKLVPGERFCPRCGREAPPVLEQVKGS